jgi:hypothetical protein
LSAIIASLIRRASFHARARRSAVQIYSEAETSDRGGALGTGFGRLRKTGGQTVPGAAQGCSSCPRLGYENPVIQPPDIKPMRRVLKDVFGFEDFRPG